MLSGSCLFHQAQSLLAGRQTMSVVSSLLSLPQHARCCKAAASAGAQQNSFLYAPTSTTSTSHITRSCQMVPQLVGRRRRRQQLHQQQQQHQQNQQHQQQQQQQQPAFSTVLTAAATLRSYATTSVSTSPYTDYRIAVPSYDRASTLQQNTLKALAAAGIDCSSRVDVFVAGEAEADKYARVLQPGTYSSIKVGRLGIGRQRDYILDHYGAGRQVVMVDDDLQRFLHVYDDDDAPVQLDLHRAILRGFQLSHEHGCYMWGLNNSSNKFFMHNTYSVGWCFFQGPFMAFRVRDEVRLHPEYHEIKEDVQYSLMHCELDDKALRLNGLGVKAKPYGKEPGGLQTHLNPAKREALAHANREYLMTRYGKFIRAWDSPDPHPSMRRSPNHSVRPLPAADLYRNTPTEKLNSQAEVTRDTPIKEHQLVEDDQRLTDSPSKQAYAYR